MVAASILFSAGERPDGGVIHRHAGGGNYSVSLDPSAAATAKRESTQGPGGCWLELLVNGLTFDLTGLAPGPSADIPESTYLFGLSDTVVDERLEAITLEPGPHLGRGAEMMPVLRTLAGLTAALASLPGARAVAWHGARCWCEPDYFAGAILRWLDGGAFPGLGLAALGQRFDGGWQSEGLSLFTGQELLIAEGLAGEGSATMRLALRLMHWLVEQGGLERPQVLATAELGPLNLEPAHGGHIVSVTRG